MFQHCTVHKAEQDEILIWRFPIKAGTFPTPLKSPPATGDKSLRWLHWGSQESILGLLLAGSIWPSSREGIGVMQENDCPLGFFCRVQESDHTPASMAAMATQLYWHGKNMAGIGAMGRWDGWYHKATCANTHIEQRALRHHECVRSASKDGRYCMRSDCTSVDTIFLSAKVPLHLQSWGRYKSNEGTLPHFQRPAIPHV